MDDEEQSGAGPGTIAIQICASWPGTTEMLAISRER
jgi:hypothetical protein